MSTPVSIQTGTATCKGGTIQLQAYVIEPYVDELHFFSSVVKHVNIAARRQRTSRMSRMYPDDDSVNTITAHLNPAADRLNIHQQNFDRMPVGHDPRLGMCYTGTYDVPDNVYILLHGQRRMSGVSFFPTTGCILLRVRKEAAVREITFPFVFTHDGFIMEEFRISGRFDIVNPTDFAKLGIKSRYAIEAFEEDNVEALYNIKEMVPEKSKAVTPTVKMVKVGDTKKQIIIRGQAVRKLKLKRNTKG